MKLKLLVVSTGLFVAISMGVLLGVARDLAVRRPDGTNNIINDQAVLSLFKDSALDLEVIGPYFGDSDTLLVVAGGICSDCNTIGTLYTSESSGLVPVLYVFHPTETGSDEVKDGAPEGVSVLYNDLFSPVEARLEPFSLVVKRDGTVTAARQLALPTKDLRSTSDLIDYMVNRR